MDEVKTLYVCGCSMMTVLRKDRDHPDDLKIPHFVETYAEDRGFQMFNLARPGATNFHITLQIDRAIQDRADYVIIGATSSDRFDLSLKEEWTFQLPLVLDNVDHRIYSGMTSRLWVDQKDPFIITNTLKNLLEIYENVSEDQKTALKYYVNYLHNTTLQNQKDALMIEASLARLVRAGIDFVFLPGHFKDMDWSWLGDRLWQGVEPWDLIFGIQRDNINHNPPEAHRIFLEILEKMTPHWR